MMNNEEALKKVVFDRLSLAKPFDIHTKAGLNIDQVKGVNSFPIFPQGHRESNAPASVEPLMYKHKPISSDPVSITRVGTSSSLINRNIYTFHRDLPIFKQQVSNPFYNRKIVSNFWGIPEQGDIEIENLGVKAEGAIGITSKELQTKQWRHHAGDKTKQEAEEEFLERVSALFDEEKHSEEKGSDDTYAAEGKHSEEKHTDEAKITHDKIYEKHETVGGSNPMKYDVKPAFSTKLSPIKSEKSEPKSTEKFEIFGKKAIIDEPEKAEEVADFISHKLDSYKPTEKVSADDIRYINNTLRNMKMKTLPNATKTKKGIITAIHNIAEQHRQSKYHKINDDSADEVDTEDDDDDKPKKTSAKERTIKPTTFKQQHSSIDDLYQYAQISLRDEGDLSPDINYINTALGRLKYKTINKNLRNKGDILLALRSVEPKTRK